MIRVKGVGRRMLIGAVGLCAMGLGWLLLYEITSPGVAAKLSTAPLAVVIALQVFPVLGWLAWRVDRAANAGADLELSAVQPHVVTAGCVAEPKPVITDDRPAGFAEVVPVHRIVHVTRARAKARTADGAVVR